MMNNTALRPQGSLGFGSGSGTGRRPRSLGDGQDAQVPRGPQGHDEQEVQMSRAQGRTPRALPLYYFEFVARAGATFVTSFGRAGMRKPSVSAYCSVN